MDFTFFRNNRKKSIVSYLWILTVLFYLLRTIAEPLKYLFIISSATLIICYLYIFVRENKINRIISFLIVIKEFLILGLFIILGIVLSSQFELLSIKSLINFLVITFLCLIYFEFHVHIQLIKITKKWVILTLLVGTLGLLKWLNFILDLNLGLFSMFYKYGSSLVSDYNFYAGYFIISLIILLYAIRKKVIRNCLIINQAILFLFFLNIVLTGSRRGLIVLALTFLVLVFYVIIKRREKQQVLYKNILFFNVLISSTLLILVLLIPFRSAIIIEKSTKTKIARTVYRYSTIFIPSITYTILYDKIWPKAAAYENDKRNWEKYATYNNLVQGTIRNGYRDLTNDYWLRFESKKNPNNILYNGNFKLGLKFWGDFCPDSIKHEIINSDYGKSLRVSRFEGEGYWPLAYTGRKIIYYKGVTYTFKFKYHVIKGSEVPFMIGWWVNEGDGFINRLPKNIRRLENEWFEYTASYRFKSDQYNLRVFMNSQQAHSIIDFADIELTCDDPLDRPKFLDQIKHIEGHNLFYNSNFENGLVFWGTETPDTVNHELVDTQYGKAIRVSRNNGKGYWPLVYQGREIFYYKGLIYHFRFKFRVIKGEESPFNIGWWVEGEEQKQHLLQKNIFPLDEEWFECIASYKFDNDHYGDIPTFMNSQKANTIIDFADIELLCHDTLDRPMYADEKIDLINRLEEARITKELGIEDKKPFSERTERWKYAFELWKTEYNWTNKLFGGGFDYLKKFGKKFYPEEDRIDYPHNPIISSFLYSGIIGGVFYIYFLALSLWYYWKYRKHHLLFFILFLITFVFVFISSDSHFNVPIFAMLSLVPFITRYLVNEQAKGSN